VTPAAAIAGFGTSDAILLPFASATGASYAPTDPGAGVLTITGEGQDGEQQTLGVLTLLGMNADSQFSVSGAPGGGTLLTTTTAQNGSSGSGGSTMSGSTTPGGQVWDTDQFIGDQPTFEQQALDAALAGLTSWVFNSPDGSFYGAYPDFGYANIALASDPQAYGALVALPYGYKVLIADGNDPINVVDWNIGNALLIGNSGNDSITSTAQNDTMLGAVGANTVFWATGKATMVGGGNDIFVGGDGSLSVTTSTNGLSAVWLGPANNNVILNGSDSVACNSSSEIASDTVRSEGGANTGCLAVGPDVGEMFYYAGAGQASIVGHAGTMVAYGSTGYNLVIGTNGYLEYVGGAGTALVVGLSGDMYIQGGAGAITVFGGTGEGEFSAQAGNSYFVVGDGPSTVDAAAGNVVWLQGSANVVTSVNGGGVIAWGANSSGNNTFQAGSGPATLVGGYGNDVFEAGSGNATLEGGSGIETFSFTEGTAGGSDVLQNFVPGRDIIALHGYSEAVATILSHDTVKGGSTTVALSDGTHITLDGVTKLTASSFTTS
jgi:Ca2+-binding RTX toxin-like protein